MNAKPAIDSIRKEKFLQVRQNICVCMHRNTYIYISQNTKEEKLSLMPEQKEQ